MKKYIQNQKGKNLFKNIQNKKKYRKRSNSIELNENYNDYLSKEKNNRNISDISSYKQIKKIKNISAPNKTFYPKNILSHNTNTYIPINLCSMPKTKKYLNSLNKLNYNLKLNKAKTISEQYIEKTIYNNSNTNNKIFDCSIYLPDEFRELASYKNIDFKFPKSKDFHNTKIEKRKSFNNTSKFVLSRNNVNEKLKINPENYSLTNKENKYINEYNKIYVNIYNPNKILNNKRKSEDPPEISKEFENKEIKKREYNSLGLSKKQLQNKLYQKIKAKENLSLEQKVESIKNGNKIKEKIILKNKSMKELNHSNIIMPKIINNNNSTILEQKDSIKVFNANDSNKLIKKSNLLKTPKNFQKINEDLPKITNYNYDDSPKSKVHVLPNENNQEYNSIKNGGFFNINKDLNKVNNSSKVVNSFVDKKIEIKEEFIRNNKNYKTSKFIQKSLFINEINTYNIKNKKILNIFPIKTKNTNEKNKNNIFLNKIIKRNQCQNKDLLLNRKVKKNKKSILFNQMNNINKVIPNKNIINSSYEFNIEQIVHQYLEVYEEDNYKNSKNYENIYSELKQTSLLNILLYSYRPFIFKCSLDQNIINYLLLNNFLSSIFVPLVDCTKRRSALFISNKLFIIQKNITVFEDKKSKFIESKKSKKIFQNISLNFINKELFYLHLNNDSDKKKLMFQSPKKERKIYSYKTNSYKNNSNSIPKKSGKKASIFSDNNYISQLTMNRRIQKLSVLQNKLLFEMPNKNKDKNGFLTKIKRRGVVNQENKFERIATKQSKTYYNLIHNINDLEEINEIYNSLVVLKNLIKKGEVLLFMEYLNNNSRKIDINIQDEDGNTFLILSIKHSLNKLSKILLEKGINVNVQNNDGNTALHYALSGKNFYMADILRKYGANEDFVNKLGYTPWDCIGKNIEIDAIY